MLPVLFGFLILITFILVLTLLAGRLITQRPKPDHPDSPANHGLPFEEVTFPSRYKVMLKGWWIPAAQPRGTLIFSHGQSGSMDGDLKQAVPLHAAGYNILMFNYRAHGTSEGKTMTFGVFEKEDLLGAVDFLHKHKGIQKVGVIGFSLGAAIAMISAALTDKIAVLVLDGVFQRFLDVVKARLRQYYVPPILSTLVAQMIVLGASGRTNTRIYQVSPRLWARHLDRVPVLFIHGEKDRLIPLAAVQALASDLNGAHQIWVAPNSDHREAFQKHPAEYQRQIVAWLDEHLS